MHCGQRIDPLKNRWVSWYLCKTNIDSHQGSEGSDNHLPKKQQFKLPLMDVNKNLLKFTPLQHFEMASSPETRPDENLWKQNQAIKYNKFCNWRNTKIYYQNIKMELICSVNDGKISFYPSTVFATGVTWYFAPNCCIYWDSSMLSTWEQQVINSVLYCYCMI